MTTPSGGAGGRPRAGPEVVEGGRRGPAVPLLPLGFTATLYPDVERLRRRSETAPEERRWSTAMEVGTAVAIALAVLLVVLACVYVVGLFAVPRPTVGAGG